MATLGRAAKKPRCKEQNAESQRRFRARQKEKDDVTLQLINTKFEELEAAQQERNMLEFEQQILLSRLYVGGSIYQGQCQASSSAHARMTEPVSNKKPICSIVKDLAVLLAIPQRPPPPSTAPMPSTSEVGIACVGEEGDREAASVNTPQCSNNTEISSAGGTKLITHTATTSAPPPAAKEAAIAAAASSGVDTESKLYLLAPPRFSNLQNELGNHLATTHTATSSPTASGVDTVAAHRSIHTAEDFLRHHSNLVEALSAASMSSTENIIGNGNQNTEDTARLSSLYTAMSNICSLYWHTAQLKPEVSVDAACAKLPQNTEFAVEIASKLVQEFDAKDLAEFRKASRDYERHMTRVSVSMESWIGRIKACDVPKEPVSLALAARVSLELVKCVSNLNAAVADGIKARRQMLENLKPKLTLHHSAFINLCSYPYMPDHVAVYTLIQETAREIHRNTINNTNTNTNTHNNN